MKISSTLYILPIHRMSLHTSDLTSDGGFFKSPAETFLKQDPVIREELKFYPSP